MARIPDSYWGVKPGYAPADTRVIYTVPATKPHAPDGNPKIPNKESWGRFQRLVEYARACFAEDAFPTLGDVRKETSYADGRPDLAFDIGWRHVFLVTPTQAEALIGACETFDPVAIARACWGNASFEDALAELRGDGSDVVDASDDDDDTDADAE